MPLINISLVQGHEVAFLKKLQVIVIDSVIESLNLPDDDRNIRLTEFPEYCFRMKKPYEILIEISLFSGRSREKKIKLYNAIVSQIEKELGISKTKIFILLNEQIKENWGIRGGIPADDVTFALNPEI